MSMCQCEKCDAYIDSDDDPDCFIEDLTGYLGRDRIICETCRESEDDEIHPEPQERVEAQEETNPHQAQPEADPTQIKIQGTGQ